MKLEIKKENIPSFKTYLEALGKLGDEMLISFENEGILMRIDYAGSVVGRLILNKDYFSVFEGEDKYVVFLRDILSYLKKVKDELIITDENNILNIKSGKSVFKTPLIAELKNYPKLPELTFDGKVTVTADDYNDMISTLGTVKPNVIKLERNNSKFMVKTQSNQREVISEITATEVNSVNDYVFIDFSYLEMFNIKGVYKINLFFKKDIPMIANIEDTNSKIELLIAPRVGEEF